MGRIVASGIDAAANIAAAGMNLSGVKDTNKTNLQIGREVNDANRQLAEKQNQWNLEQWNRENAYNDPSRQVERLTGAGLSQAAAAQSIDGAGNAGSIQSADLANQQMPAAMQAPQIDLSAIPSVLGAMRQIVELRKGEAEAKVEETKAQNADMVVLTPLEAQQAATRLNLQTLRQRAKENPYSLRKLKYEVEAARYLPGLQQAALNQAKVNFDLAKQKFGFLEKFNDEQMRKIGEEIKGVIVHAQKERQDIAESKTRQGLIDAQTENVDQSTENLRTENVGLKLDNLGKAISDTLQKFGSPSSDSGRIGALVTDGILPYNMVTRYLWNARSYVLSGGRVFNGDSDLRSVFVNELLPGIGKDNNLPVWSHGTFNIFGKQLAPHVENDPILGNFFKSKKK